MRPLYIFDLDGTLALIEHRRHFVENGNKQWPEFYAACVDDAPNAAVIKVFQSLLKSGAECWIWSGRSDEVRKETERWLYANKIWGAVEYYGLFQAPEHLMMRKSGDYTPDDKLKYGWLADLEPPERNRVTAVFDDRDRMVKMWRDAGITCLQVAPGDF